MTASPAPDPPADEAFRRRHLLLWGLLGLVVFGLVAASAWCGLMGLGSEPLPILGSVPPFDLTNRDDRRVTLEDLSTGPWIADFIFTRCPAICPRMTQQMQKIDTALPAGSPVRLVSFSVDPEHDTPAVLADFARRFDAGERWYFLTGEAEAIHRLSRDGFKLALDTAPPPEVSNDPIAHSNRFVLVDGEARIRGYYDPFDPQDVERLLKDVRRVRRES